MANSGLHPDVPDVRDKGALSADRPDFDLSVPKFLIRKEINNARGLCPIDRKIVFS